MAARTSLRWPLICALLAVLVHWRALGNELALDDVQLVESNPAVVSLAHIPRLFVEPQGIVDSESSRLYRPLTLASFSVNRALLGAGPFGFHLVNLLLHGAATALVWVALRRAGTHYGTAFLGGCLFAVLPMHAEAVANLAGRAELLAAVFVLGAWIAHRRANEAKAAAGRWQTGAAVFYLAAILSEERAVLAPLLFLADDLLRGREASPRRGWLLVGYAGVCAVMLGLRGAALGVPSFAVAPIRLDNSVAQALADPTVLARMACLAALVAIAVWGWKHSRPVALAVIVWAVFFLPTAILLFPAGTSGAERLAYLPSLGVCLLFAHLGAAFAARPEPQNTKRARVILVVVLASIVVSGFAVRTWTRAGRREASPSSRSAHPPRPWDDNQSGSSAIDRRRGASTAA